MTDLNKPIADDGPPLDIFAQLRAVKDEIDSTTLEVFKSIPGWHGRLTGRFTPLTTAEKSDLQRRIEQRANLTGQEGQSLTESAAVDRISVSCRNLFLDGNPIPPGELSGFSPDFGVGLGLPEDASIQAVARKACGNPKSDEFGVFFAELQEWWGNPRPKGSTDPFGRAR